MKTYVFDIDGTICSKKKNSNYKDSKPFIKRIKKINKLYLQGNTIIFQTARGMGRNKNDIGKAILQFHDLTVKQLKSWGVKYHMLFMGKPSGDIYIDDKGIKDEDFFDTRN
jgi:capsule biosynthesis phosphatase